MFGDVKLTFDLVEKRQFSGIDSDYAETTEEGHGRKEVRRCWAIDDELQLQLLRNREKWTDLQPIVMIESERTVFQQPTSVECR